MHMNYCAREDSWETLDIKEIQPVNPKRNQPWIFIKRTDDEAEAPILCPPDAEATHWKRPWCCKRLKVGGEGNDRGWDGQMASLINGHEFEQAPRDSEGQGSLACCSPWGHKESNTTEWLNNNNKGQVISRNLKRQQGTSEGFWAGWWCDHISIWKHHPGCWVQTGLHEVKKEMWKPMKYTSSRWDGAWSRMSVGLRNRKGWMDLWDTEEEQWTGCGDELASGGVGEGEAVVVTLTSPRPWPLAPAPLSTSTPNAHSHLAAKFYFSKFHLKQAPSSPHKITGIPNCWLGHLCSPGNIVAPTSTPHSHSWPALCPTPWTCLPDFSHPSGLSFNITSSERAPSSTSLFSSQHWRWACICCLLSIHSPLTHTPQMSMRKRTLTPVFHHRPDIWHSGACWCPIFVEWVISEGNTLCSHQSRQFPSWPRPCMPLKLHLQPHPCTHTHTHTHTLPCTSLYACSCIPHTCAHIHILGSTMSTWLQFPKHQTFDTWFPL